MKTTITLISLLVALNLLAYEPIQGKIMTQWAEEVTPENVWQEYPRPQFERSEWMNLNGLWDYALLPNAAKAPVDYQGEILVPFCIESALSGVGKQMKPTDRLWYKRMFEVPNAWDDKDVLLHFDAVDYETTVWVNGALVGAHKGGHKRFSFNVSPYLNENDQQELVVSVVDKSNMTSQPRGKQQIHPGGIMYTAVSGIWQTVWLEPVATDAYIQEVKITPNIDDETVTVLPILSRATGRQTQYKVKASFIADGKLIKTTEIFADKAGVIQLRNVKLWSPNQPFLYDLKLELMAPSGLMLDEVTSYFGMRKISMGEKDGQKIFMLNNEYLFHYGTLDQGWWPDGLYTAPSDEALKYDIEMTQKMGFNTIRKHIKVEPDRWFYHCDRLGMLVWQDMPSGFTSQSPNDDRNWYHIIGGEEQQEFPSKTAAQFEWELHHLVSDHYNAPSVVMWVTFNEGWGQYESSCRVSDMIKQLDPSRLVNTASGWAIRPCGDVFDLHNYEVDMAAPVTPYPEMANVLGEFGGVGFPVKGHLWDPKLDNWGYQTYHNEKEAWNAYKHKFNQILKFSKKSGLAAAIYTQTTDVETEVNGLMTYDRKVLKLPMDSLYNNHIKLYQQEENK